MSVFFWANRCMKGGVWLYILGPFAEEFDDLLVRQIIVALCMGDQCVKGSKALGFAVQVIVLECLQILLVEPFVLPGSVR